MVRKCFLFGRSNQVPQARKKIGPIGRVLLMQAVIAFSQFPKFGANNFLWSSPSAVKGEKGKNLHRCLLTLSQRLPRFFSLFLLTDLMLQKWTG